MTRGYHAAQLFTVDVTTGEHEACGVDARGTDARGAEVRGAEVRGGEVREADARGLRRVKETFLSGLFSVDFSLWSVFEGLVLLDRACGDRLLRW